MSASSQSDSVRTIAAPAADRAGLVLEDVVVTPAGRRRVLRITVDLPPDRLGGVPLDAVADASREISAALDASDVMGGTPYVLEVSSPGTDRPLTEPRHWSRARRRLVRVRLADGGADEGRLTAVDDVGVELDGARRLPWDAVRDGRVEVEFGRTDDAGDADDIDDAGDTDDAAADEALDDEAEDD